MFIRDEKNEVGALQKSVVVFNGIEGLTKLTIPGLVIPRVLVDPVVGFINQDVNLSPSCNFSKRLVAGYEAVRMMEKHYFNRTIFFVLEFLPF